MGVDKPYPHGYEDIDPRSVGDEWAEAVDRAWQNFDRALWSVGPLHEQRSTRLCALLILLSGCVLVGIALYHAVRPQ